MYMWRCNTAFSNIFLSLYMDIGDHCCPKDLIRKKERQGAEEK